MPPRKPAPEIPGFTLIDWLGGGGFADVFRYHDHSLDREVAIKVLHRGGSTDRARQAFRTEASLMAKLSSHPNIVSVFQMGVADDGRPFLVMEMCATQHLGDTSSRRPYSPAKAMELGIQIAGAVETAHRLGILHRDIKPSNIMFTAFGRPALTDFGISISLDQGASAQLAMSPLWAPPEQFGSSAGSIGPWSDVYSLSATVWALMVGHSPMYLPGESNDRLNLEARIRTMQVPRTLRPDVPEELERVLAVGMAKEAHARFQTAIEFARALQSVQGVINQPVTSIDVFTEPGQEHYDEEELLDEGTRISGFQLIDPDQVDHTSSATGPTSGSTTLEGRDSTGGGYGSTRPRCRRSRSARFHLHGRTSGAAAERARRCAAFRTTGPRNPRQSTSPLEIDHIRGCRAGCDHRGGPGVHAQPGAGSHHPRCHRQHEPQRSSGGSPRHSSQGHGPDGTHRRRQGDIHVDQPSSRTGGSVPLHAVRSPQWNRLRGNQRNHRHRIETSG